MLNFFKYNMYFEVEHRHWWVAEPREEPLTPAIGQTKPTNLVVSGDSCKVSHSGLTPLSYKTHILSQVAYLL